MPLSANHVTLVENLVFQRGGYDLEENDLGAVSIDDWTGFPTRQFSYEKRDADGVVKRGVAVMLNPPPIQVARWIVDAVIRTSGAFTPEFAKELVREASIASGFQFVIRGVHLEDMDGGGKHTAFPFFNGVTVKLDTIADGWPTRVLSSEELQSTIDTSIGHVTKIGKYARIQSTTRQEYWDAGGTEDVSDANWLRVVRELYQAAWGNDLNFLMVAKAQARRQEWGF